MATQNLMLGDCLKWMKSLPDKYYDLAIVDPPYGIGMGSILNVNSNVVFENKNWDYKIPDNEYFIELIRVSNNQIIWGGNYFPLLWENGCKKYIFWNKLNHHDNRSDGELAWTSLNGLPVYFEYMWDGNRYGFKDNLKGIGKKTIRIHPTEKPVELYKFLLTNYAKSGQKIFDSHGGSFSHAIAAYDLGFDLDIIEIDPDYYRDGKTRYDAHVTKCEEIKQFGFAKTELSKNNPTLF